MASAELILEMAGKFFENNAPRPIRPGQDYIPASGKVLDASDLQNLIQASLNMWLTTGPFAKEFETEFAKYMQQKFCLLVNSGSSANLLAFSTLTSPSLGERQIRPGDEMITLAASFPTTVNPAVQYGCVPVFLDVDPKTLAPSLEDFEKALSSKTKLVMLAHALGNPFDAKKIRDFCDRNNLWLIEDCCDAVGAQLYDKSVGTYGHLATASFYPAHHITMGEGGAVLTSDPRLRRIAESFRDWGRDCWCPPGKDNSCKKRFDWDFSPLPDGYDHKYIYTHIGYNLKLTDMQAAVGCSQLKRLDHFVDVRRKNFEQLRKLIMNKVPNWETEMFFCDTEAGAKPSWFGFPVTLLKRSRKDLLVFLEANKIGTRLLFGGNLVKQPLYKQIKYRMIGELVGTDQIMHSTLWLGIYPALGEPHMEYISDKLAEFFAKP